MNTRGVKALLFSLLLIVLAPTNAVAKACFHKWAKPGTYTITGNFRGKIETAGAKLSRNCRIHIRVPGVLSGTKVRRSGRCLRFGFKVRGVKRAFTAKWCNKVGYLPWKGRKVRATVRRVGRVAQNSTYRQ